MKLLGSIVVIISLALATGSPDEASCDGGDTDLFEDLDQGHCQAKSKAQTNELRDRLLAWWSSMEDPNTDFGEDIKAYIEDGEDGCLEERHVKALFQSDGDTWNPIATRQELNGPGKVKLRNGSELVAEEFIHGRLEPGVRVDLNVTSADLVLRGRVDNNICLSGLVRGFTTEFKNLTAVTKFRQGLPEGPIWLRTLSVWDNVPVGFLYKDVTKMERELEEATGEIKKNDIASGGLLTQMSGDHVAFIYPDMETALYGKFEKGVMIDAKEVRVEDVTFFEDGTAPRLSFAEATGPSFHFEESNTTHMGAEPLLRDPYEVKTVDVLTSNIPKAGQGVFLLRDVPANTIVSFFNGIRVREKEIFNLGSLLKKKSVYLVELGEEDEYLDILPEYVKWDDYKASSGHKVNHAKEPNSGYTECHHPRFGRILCLQTYQSLKAGTELLTQYDVAFDKQGMKELLKTALSVGHFFSGKSKTDFVKSVKPYLNAASKIAETIKVDDLVKF